MKTMTFKELLDKHTDEKIIKRTNKLYPKFKKCTEGYEKALKELRKTELAETDITINIEHFTEDEFGYDSYDRVDGLGKPWDEDWNLKLPKKQQGRGYALEYTEWSQWLSMPISEFTTQHYCELDILAHCLWEMTWSGFSNKKIQKEWTKIVGIKEKALKEMKDKE